MACALQTPPGIMPSPDDNGRRSWDAHQTPAEPRPVPLAVRRKLVESGQTLSATQWRRLPAAARRRLELMPSESGTDRRTFATLVDWLRLTFAEPGRVTQRDSLPPPGAWPWRHEQPPAHVARAIADAPIDWATLDLDRRYGLVEAASEPEPDALRRYVEGLVASCDRSSVVA